MKKILVVSALALGLSSAALAGGIAEKMPPAPKAVAPVACSTGTSGIYVGLQGGYGDNGMKALDGTYVLSNINAPATTDAYTLKVDKDKGLAGRAFVGYQFNKYFAVEAGYTLFRKGTLAFNGLTSWATTNNFTYDVKTQSFDLLGKAMAPINDEFGFFAKVGPGYLMQQYSVPAGAPSIDNANKINLVYGFGAYYTLNNWYVDLSWTRFNSGDVRLNSKSWQSVADFYALGVSYKFDI